ncbi:MAG: HDIG domain-containing protein [Clostridia bacterium]|nr:HDIG domain-containing protein [Clostridia bacterium]
MSGTIPEKENKPRAMRFRALLQRFGAWLHGNGMRVLLLMAGGCIVLFALCCTVCVSNRYSLDVGDISDRNIAATKDVEDRLSTTEARNRAAAAIGPTYHLNDEVTQRVLQNLDGVFAEMRAVQQYGITVRMGRQQPAGTTMTFTADEVRHAQQLVTAFNLTAKQARILMNTDDDVFSAMQTTVTTAVTSALEKTVAEGQVKAVIDDIIDDCESEYEFDDELLDSVVRQVLGLVVEANMLVDEAATEAARERARAAVPPVTFKQGQFIIREGERVTQNQLDMLSELGLLTSSDFNFSVYGGAMLLIVCAMIILWMLLKLLEPSALGNVRTLLVVLLVMVISEALSALSITLINAYLSPVALCAILLTGLMGPRIGAAAGVTMTVIVSGLSAASSNAYSNEMVCLLLTGIAGTIVSVRFLADKSQRVSVVVCGALVAVTNLVVMLAIGLMTAVNLGSTFNSAIWTMAGALLSGLIAVGFQPVFEAAFNLATPSKLMELANPNHPLLRRLLMEAPGTYHHSIIVANLAEAAAERIGANMLLARTGAYFHDVGKLKRPLYFKENQHGDNPHDRTTAHLSAAIVTAHTTDGLRLAQKHRLPVEIQQIIAEHHGDTPVMYFYHKALQQADGKAVDVKDFRYSGNRPSTKESAIVMLADTIEAAVRSMSEPTPQAITQFIERLVRGKIEDGQLSNSPLSLHDIDGISDAFINVLRGVFHERIEYPAVHIDRRDDDAVAEKTGTESDDGMAAPYSPPMPDGLVPPAEDAEGESEQ